MGYNRSMQSDNNTFSCELMAVSGLIDSSGTFYYSIIVLDGSKANGDVKI